MKTVYKILPCLFLALFLSEIIAVLVPKKDGEFQVQEFGRLPVLLDGRIQPFDSVAHNSLLQIRSTGDVPLEEVPAWKFWHHPEKIKSTAWLLEVMCRPEVADTRPIFLIHLPELLGELRLEQKGVEKSGLRYYTFKQIEPEVGEIMQQADQATSVPDKARTPFQRQVLKLANAVSLYSHLKNTLHPPGSGDLSGRLDEIQAAIEPGIAAITAKDQGKSFQQDAFDKLSGVMNDFYSLQQDPRAGVLYPLAIPPVGPEAGKDAWGNIGFGVIQSIRARAIIPPLRWLASAATAYHAGRATDFNEAVGDYSNWLARNFPIEAKKGQHEFYFNAIKPFLHAIIIYLAALVLGLWSLLTFGTASQLSEALRRSAFALILLALVVHTGGLIFRMVLEGRPPVTNLYSSAIFIGWAAVIFGAGLEMIYRVVIGILVAALAGFVTLLIAHNLAIGGDTMEMLQAVLDTNFWLATHVVVVTLGYASTFVAGLLAVLYIGLGMFTPILSQPLRAASGTPVKATKSGNQMTVGRAMTMMVYGIVCFATLFSFVGTVLGGIWADQSWGRFWGWDVKENGALIIVIWNATILHARWGGMVRERGLMNMAVFGNVVTSFSWFGVNMLGIGLHSYGFMEEAFQWLRAFIILMLVIIAIGSLPRKYWRSFRESGPEIGKGKGPNPATAPT